MSSVHAAQRVIASQRNFHGAALGFMIVGLVATAWCVDLVRQQHQEVVRAEFDALAAHVRQDVARRFERTLYGLRGIRAMYATGLRLDREDFRAWVRSRDLDTEFPGVRGLGVIWRVPRGDLAEFVARERADAAPGFTVRTQGDLSPLYVITHIEPMDRNLAAWGYDVGSEPLRREAAEVAARTGEPALTRAIRLVQDGQQRPGFLYFVPMYAGGVVPATQEERLAQHRGFSYAPIVAAELLATVAEDHAGLIDFELIDRSPGHEEVVIFDHDGHLMRRVGHEDQIGPDRAFQRSDTMQIGGRELIVQVSTTPSFNARYASWTPWGFALGGGVISVLGALALFQAGRARHQALTLAQSMTADLAASKTRAEEVSRENQALNTVIRSQFIVSMTDRQGVIIEVNDAFCQISGYVREDLLGQHHRCINSGVHPPAFWRDLWSTIAGGRPWRGEICNRAKDGRFYWVASVIAPLFDETGAITRFISIRSDITARKQAEADLAEMNRVLEEQTAFASSMAARAEMANGAKSAFLANMSHEIRTPMNGVLGMAELLLGMGLNREQEDAARTITRSAQALLTILNDILDFSKIEAGRMDLEAIPLDLHQLVYDVAELVRGRLAVGEVHLLVRVMPGVPRRWVGDPGRVRQILNNLLGNAVKFTRAGHILIEVGPHAGGGVLIRIEDTGVGIPPDRQARLFQPFSQADASTARQFGGTGLGLVISRRLAEAMGGSIDLASTEGVGTTFSVHLPIPVDPAATETPPPPLAGRRIGVVEGIDRLRDILAEQLATLGADVHAVADPSTLPEDLDSLLVDVREPGAEDIVRRRTGLRCRLRLVPVPVGAPPLEGTAFTGQLVVPSPADQVVMALTSTAWQERTEHPAPEVPTVHRRVLLAEDNPVNQKVGSLMLRRLGCEVTVVSDGSQALEALATGDFDLVLMDCQMPGVDGFEATRQWRMREQEQGLPRQPVVAMTANAADEDREACLEAGMDDHLAKPTSLDALQRILERWAPS